MPDGVPLRPVTTYYSIVARDSATGQLVVAVQSHWFSVGPSVAWARAIEAACDHAGDGFSVQANLMHRPGVCDAGR